MASILPDNNGYSTIATGQGTVDCSTSPPLPKSDMEMLAEDIERIRTYAIGLLEDGLLLETSLFGVTPEVGPAKEISEPQNGSIPRLQYATYSILQHLNELRTILDSLRVRCSG